MTGLANMITGSETADCIRVDGGGHIPKVSMRDKLKSPGAQDVDCEHAMSSLAQAGGYSSCPRVIT